MKTSRILILSAATLLLIGCGKGGGGGGGADPFTGFSMMQPGGTYAMDAFGLVADVEQDLGTGYVTPGAAEEFTGRANVKLDGAGDPSSASLEAAPSLGWGSTPLLEFNAGNGDMITDGNVVDPLLADYLVATSVDLNDIAIAADPTAMGFEYQTFGIWQTGVLDMFGQIGVASAGMQTPLAQVPVAGTATYHGGSAGFYVRPDGEPFLAFADFDALINFGAHTIDASTSGTQVMHGVTGVVSPMASLNFSGSGTVGGDGSFSASISTADLAGSLDGVVYGTNAAELGGVFMMQGAGGEYMGAVGAVQ